MSGNLEDGKVNFNILGEEHGFHYPVNLSMTIDHLTPL